MKKLKIAIICPLSFPINKNFAGGLESFLYFFSQELIKQGHRLTLFASGDSKIPGVKIIPICKQGLKIGDDSSRSFLIESIKNDMALNFKLMKDLLNQINNFDVFHFNSNNFLLLALQNKSLIKKSVSTLHVPIDSSIIKNLQLALNMGELTKINFVTISDFQRKQGKKINLNIIDRVHNGIPIQEFGFQKNSNRYVGWLGRIYPGKGLDIAVKIAHKNNWHFRFAGPIHLQEYYDDKIKPYLSKNIEYLGPIFGQKKSKFYGGCDVFLAPIEWDEPFGLTIIEAMACGVPVVAFNRGAMKELIVEGKTGYIVKADDEKGFTNAVERAKKLSREECRQHVEKNFTLERMTKNYIEVYKKLIG